MFAQTHASSSAESFQKRASDFSFSFSQDAMFGLEKEEKEASFCDAVRFAVY